MTPPDQYDTPEENPRNQAGTPNPANSNSMDQRKEADSPKKDFPKASGDNRWRSAALKAEHAARSVTQRVQPAAQHFGRRAMLLIRKLWLWLWPLLQRFGRQAALLARRVQRWAAPYVQRVQRWAAPHVQRIQERAAPYLQRVQRWAAPYVQRVRAKVAPHVAAVRAKLPTRASRHHRVPSRVRSVQIGAAAVAFGILAIVVGNVGSESRAVDPAVQADGIPAPTAEAPAAQPKEAPAEGQEESSDDDSGQAEIPIGPDPSGIDVSNHNGSINWDKVADSGKEFAFVLATDGQSFTNPLFQQQFDGAKEADMLVGAYHFARPTGSAVAQADRLVNTMGTTDDAKTLPPVLDMEVSPSGGGCYGKTAGEMQGWMQTFLDQVKDRTGEKGIVYANPSFWSQCMNGSDAFSDYPLWVAAYGVDSPSVPGGWNEYTFWQFTSKGHVPGINGYTDINEFRGSGEDLLELAD
ncbi:GH25 family lysozyme [Haloactinomyces albus]|uniref:GH25 family lysozyme M1 (1,4-beta-N-acetylmuramidase) n=1 Tax=Haloactinomyces albus TaxID=1352928 RepID=A0AAE4CK38_9ACTN|nr:GH25 family lysozyme [Haloactinomyces albus]MDR7300354.1 GH25 family lysozyme M1 (1,4-beta-N-acetylmuramidase) [Haloactinomyces albus]